MNKNGKDNNSEQLIEERRQFIRLNINVDIKYSLMPQPTNKTKSSKTRNISAGGICIMTEEAFRAGDMLKLELTLPQDPPTVYAVGRVSWIKTFTIIPEQKERYDVGVEFVEISDPDREKVRKYVFSLR